MCLRTYFLSLLFGIFTFSKRDIKGIMYGVVYNIVCVVYVVDCL